MTKTSNSPSAEAIKGSVKEAIGKLTGNDRVEAEGRRQKREANPSEAQAPEDPFEDEPEADKPRAD